jgi:hypothetical protein
MANQALEWDLGGDTEGGKAHRISLGVAGLAREVLERAYPDLLEMFPFDRQFDARAHVSPEGRIAVRTHWLPGMQTPVCGKISSPSDLETISQYVRADDVSTVAERVGALGAEWFGFDRFTYIGPIEENRVSWPDVQAQAVEWLITVVVPQVLDRNKQRVMRATPQPPAFNLAKVFAALWVLECEEKCIQGTAFALDGVGFVTCDHVIGPATVAFRYDHPEQRLPVSVLRRNATIDLAILSIDGTAASSLERGSADALQHMAHLMVAGHPNYRRGDSPITTPGLVIGFRPVSGVRRILTNAPIVAGTSGGPVVDGSGRVIGVAVTGAERFSSAHTTEDHSIVPVEALDLL